MSLSFQEKSLWLTAAGLVAAFGFYFDAALADRRPAESVDVMPHQIALFVVAIGLLVVVQVVGHVAVAVLDRRPETDERDRLIALKGTRNGSYMLATGAFFALSAAALTPGNFVPSHVLLGFWVLAQLTEIGSQLVLYRRGA